MKKHNGMRPQDIVILLKITTLADNQEWLFADLAKWLYISTAEVSESLERSKQAGLIDNSKRIVFRNSLYEFLVYGLKYVFPAIPSAVVRGIATAHAAPPLSEHIAVKNEVFVWQYSKGTIRGQGIEPLYKTVPQIVQTDTGMYELLALCDAIRIGKVREKSIAAEELKKRILNR